MTKRQRVIAALEGRMAEIDRMKKETGIKAAHILAGRKVKQAGMELSEYFTPGLGGRALSRLPVVSTMGQDARSLSA